LPSFAEVPEMAQMPEMADRGNE